MKLVSLCDLALNSCLRIELVFSLTLAIAHYDAHATDYDCKQYDERHKHSIENPS